MMISSTIAHYLDHYRKMYFETSPKRFTIESVIQWESIRILSIAVGIRAIYLSHLFVCQHCEQCQLLSHFTNHTVIMIDNLSIA